MSRPYSPLLTPTLIYPLPQVGTSAVQHSFKPFPSSPSKPLTTDKPLTQSLEAPAAYHDNRLAVPPFKQTSDDRFDAPENVGVRANLVGMGQAGGSVHRSGHAVEAFGDTETYHTPGDLNAASQLHSEYPAFLAASPNIIESAVHVSTHADTAPATEVSGHSYRSISRAHSAVDVRMPAVATLAVCHGNVGTGMVPIWGASPNFTSYANLHQPDPDYGGAPDSCSRARSGRDALVDPGRRPLFEEEEAGSSRHQSHYAPPSSHCPHSHQSQNVVGELQSPTELASLSRSGSGSTTSVAPNLLVVGRCAHDAPAADSDPHHDLSVLHSRQLATPIRNILDHDGACHGFVSLSGHDANFNSLRSLGLGNASSSATREHGEARVYMGGVHGIGELKPRPSRPTLVVPSPPPAPPTIPTDREQEEKDLLETFFGSRSRVLKIIQPTVSSSLPIIIQCVSRVTTAMRHSCTSSPIVYTARPASRFPSSPLSRAPRSPFMPQRIFSGSNSSTASPASSSVGLLSPYSPFGAGGLKTPEDLARPLRPSSGLGLDKLDEEVYVMYASHEEVRVVSFIHLLPSIRFCLLLAWHFFQVSSSCSSPTSFLPSFRLPRALVRVSGPFFPCT
ncbi:hypothetical protein BC629DRAFT_205455 [Irpex lacteus]|nr:hypothetical protein BC629DRAFT_205455 [Irpex lacteus]